MTLETKKPAEKVKTKSQTLKLWQKYIYIYTHVERARETDFDGDNKINNSTEK